MSASSSGSEGTPLVTTRAGAVADELRRLIQSGDLMPGTRLRQLDIARRYSVSTTPVREAFSILLREGLVRHDPHRGVVVFLPSTADIRENYEIRGVLEPLAVELASPLMTAAHFDRLEALLKEMRDAVDAQDITLYGVELNPRFHASIYDITGRPRLVEMISNLRDAASAYIRMTERRQTAQDIAISQTQHEAIAQALVARKARKAAAMMREHLEYNAAQIFAGLKEAVALTDEAATSTDDG